MYLRAGGPAEPEEANRDAEGAQHGRRKAVFGLELAVGFELGFEYFVDVVEEGRPVVEEGQNYDMEGGVERRVG